MRFILFPAYASWKASSGCGSCINCSDPKLKKKFGCMVTPRKKRPKRNESEALAWDLTSAEFRSPSETKTVALSVRSSVVTGSDKKAKPAEKQTPDPKSYQSQLKQLEARMKEQLKQIQHQVTVSSCTNKPSRNGCVCSCISERMPTDTGEAAN